MIAYQSEQSLISDTLRYRLPNGEDKERLIRMCKEISIDWDKIKPCENGNKIYVDNLPKWKSGKNIGKIKWRDTVGYTVLTLYQNIEYLIKIEYFDIKTKKITINIINNNFNKIDFKINCRDFLKCHLGLLVHNIYANPNSPYRQLIIDSIGEEQAKKLTMNSREKINIVCPNCKKIKTIRLNDLFTQGMSCECGDGISYPEKLMINILNKLKIEYKRQLTYDNGKHKYDFYIPMWNAIFETHGLQHYEGWQNNKENLIEQQANDEYKYNDAINNGIKDENYHQIDCRYSTLKWCRPKIENVLSQYININILTDNDWKEFDKKSQNSLVYELCKYYDNNQNLTVKELMEIFDLSNSCVSVYLHKGNDYGWCKYNGSWYMEQIKDEKESRKQQVINYKLQNPSVTNKEIAKIFGVTRGTIYKYLKDIDNKNIQTIQKNIRKQKVLEYRIDFPKATIKEMAIIFNCSETTIYNYLREDLAK